MGHLPAVSGPSAECKAPQCSNERACRPREAEQLPRVTQPAGSCSGTQTHQGPPEGCSFEHTAPPGLEGTLFPQPLALGPTHRRPGWYLVLHPQHHLPTASPSTEDGWRPPPGGCKEKPQAPTSGITRDRLRCGSRGKNTWAHTRPNGLYSNSPARGPQADTLHTGGNAAAASHSTLPPCVHLPRP